jgi:23S rRNA pseudouridine2457 synthase
MFRYLLLYKPYNVVCQFGQTTPDSLTLKDFMPISQVYPVGRLDQDSEGLLLLTNNGPLQHRIADPRFGHPRTYLVQVEGLPNENSLQILRKGGLLLKDYRIKPVKIKLLDTEPDLPTRHPPIRYRKTIPTSWLQITLSEGKNRQIRRMTAKIGFPTLRLVRISMELNTHHTSLKLSLTGLEPGQWRELTTQERINIEALKRIT